jgi:hypothetical protein
MEIKRHHFKWTINEVLKLQREYELLGMNIQDIAKSHNRSGKAILCKLEKEGFIESWYVTRGIEEFIESDKYLCDYKSFILDRDNLSSITTSETDTESETESETDNEPHTLSETETEKSLNTPKEITANESIDYFDVRNMFLLTMKLIYIIFQFVEKNFTEKMIF